METWPYRPDLSVPLTIGKNVLQSVAVSGAKKSRTKSSKKAGIELRFENRDDAEWDAALAFWDAHYPGTSFVYEDHSYSPDQRPMAVEMISEIRQVTNGYNDRSYSFQVMETDDIVPIDPLSLSSIWSAVDGDFFEVLGADEDPIAYDDSWTDASGNGRHWTSVNPTNGIIIKHNQLNGHTVTRLTGQANTHWRLPNMSSLNAGGAYLMLGLKVTSGTGDTAGFETSNGGGDYYPYVSAGNTLYIAWGSGVGWHVNAATPPHSIFAFHLLHGFNGPGKWNLNQNNSSLLNLTSGFTTNWSVSPKVGRGSWKGDVAFGYIFSGEPAAWQLAGIKEFLRIKYEIPSL